MFAKPHIRLPWASLGAALALLCLLGGGLYATRASGAGGPAAGKPGGPQLNAPAGGAAVFPAGDSPLAAGERRRLPNGTIVGRDDHHDLSPPLRDIPPVAALPRHEGPENPLPSHLAGGHVVDSVVQRFFGPLAMPAPSLTFDGISLATSGCGCLPPDTNGDVGPNDYVQTVNAAFAIWNKNGTALLTPRAINTLFSGFGGACQTQNAGDPLVNYDPLADRWVISQFTSAAPFAQCVAVSQTGDPTGSWYRYQFTESNTALYDYPKVGVWSDAYYLTANVFDNATQAFLYPSLLALDRSRMLQGLSATFQEFTPGNYYYAILPADVDGSTPPPAGAREPFLTVSGNNTQIHLWNLHVDFAAPASSHLDGPTNLTAAPWDPNLCGLAGNCIAQPGVATSAYLDSLADHTMFRLAYRRFGDGHEALVTNESVNVGGNQAGVRWYEIRDPNGAPAIYQQGTYAPDATSRWMGAAAMDRDGNLAVGYSASSTTVFPSVRYAGRLAGDPLGLLSQGEATLFAGTGAQNSGNRWGDYSDMTVDPSDDCTFWYTNEYLATTGTNWRTRIGKFKFPSCGQTPPTPTAIGTPPTHTPVPTVTATPTVVATACANYTVATTTGTVVPGTQDIGNHCDDCATNLILPFPVQLYDQTFTSAYATSNGVLSFGSSEYAFGNACLPVPIYNYAILGNWDDLTTQGTGLGIFSAITGTAPNRVFNLEWRAQLLSNNSNLNFEIQLFEGQHTFNIVYGTSIGDGGAGATIGVEHTMNAFTQVSCNTVSEAANRRFTFTLPPCPLATATATPPSSTPTRTATAGPTNTAGPSPTPCPLSFTDVQATDYFYTPVLYLACHGVISGYSNGDGTFSFRPYNNTTRSQMVKIVVLGYNKPITTPAGGAYTFADVPPANPFFAVIETAAADAIVSGYNCGGPGEPCDSANRPYFRPFANVTRGQLSKIDVVAAGWALINPPAGSFEDVLSGTAFYTFVETAVCHGVISGYSCGGPGEPCDGTNRPYFRQSNQATRGQIAKIVYLSVTHSTPCGAGGP